MVTGPVTSPDASGLSTLQDRYLELMKQCLTRYLFIDEEFREVQPGPGLRRLLDRLLIRVLASRRLRVGTIGGDRAARADGREWPAHGETMVGLARLENVRRCVTSVVDDDVPGDLIEAGVWRGGTSIYMRAVLAALGDTSRRVWVADSFQGLPPPDTTRFPIDADVDLSDHPGLSVGVEAVKANFARYGLLDSQVEFLVGWFKDTLPAAPFERLAVVRLDGDMYESTIDSLDALYPKLSRGGYVIVDDYGMYDACRQAVNDYRGAHGITDEIEKVDWTGAYWRKSG